MAKKDYFPEEQLMRVSETCAEMQDLLNHASVHLCMYLEQVIETCSEEEKKNLKFIVKWGCDWSQKTQYKQRSENSTDSDANIFQSSLVCLQTETNGRKLYGGIQCLRLLGTQTNKNNKDITNEEIQYIDSQARNLKKLKYKLKTW